MPIRGYRILVEIPEITAPNPGGVPDPAPIFVLMKRGIAEWCGLTEIKSNDPKLKGTFGGTGANQGASFIRNVGGYKTASYTIIGSVGIDITEYFDDAQGNPTSSVGTFKEVTIGFPTGHSVNEWIDFLDTLPENDKIAAYRTPRGKRRPYSAPTP